MSILQNWFLICFFFLLEKKETDASSVAESFNEEKAVSLTNNYFPTSSEVSDKCFCWSLFHFIVVKSFRKNTSPKSEIFEQYFMSD